MVVRCVPHRAHPNMREPERYSRWRNPIAIDRTGVKSVVQPGTNPPKRNSGLGGECGKQCSVVVDKVSVKEIRVARAPIYGCRSLAKVHFTLLVVRNNAS